ncbi:cobalamin B12-binding domain protein [Desulfitobacterium hafniense DCB-2]|uniref:Cobalamin B12-binding domain protein n=1 Tax=Desulfitobacterium hafniense (strain DSM 10664 / DCB-2) TaxID=272564 RepID=B8FV89_DESHD|nr:cobalamin-dependent protein [Desulfitobacterium hafniense]ACL20598.1 cobalamin B12-binding domain protein [Desulfitobacterium hafniense DCB-2]
MRMVESMLVAAVTRLDVDKVLALAVSEIQSGKDSIEIIEETRQGMTQVGHLYDQGKYFLADLMMSAEIFKDVISLVSDQTNAIAVIEPSATILFGTVKKDIHDIGKNLMISLLRFNGHKVIDLGVDVAPERFAEGCIEHRASIVCLSGLITQSYDSMRLTVQALEKMGLRPGVKVVIGGLVNEQVRQYTKADYWVKDCSEGVKLCSSLFNLKTHQEIS